MRESPLPQPVYREFVDMLARRIIRKLSEPYQVNGKPMLISGSVGIAMTPDFGPDLERLISCADAALYRSKGAGNGRLHFSTREDAVNARQAVA